MAENSSQASHSMVFGPECHKIGVQSALGLRVQGSGFI